MKLIKNTTISLFSALITVFFVYGGYTLNAGPLTDGYNYLENLVAEGFFEAGEATLGGFYFVEGDYHQDMNDYFNDRIGKLNEMLEKDNFVDDPNFNAPGEGEECNPENVSTYCVAMGALDGYLAFLVLADGFTGSTAEVVDFFEDNDRNASVGDVLQQVEVRNDDIAKAIEDARLVMEAAVATYNEYRLAAPMHKKYEKTIDLLMKYRIAVRQLRLNVDRFKGKFVDASSIQCQ